MKVAIIGQGPRGIYALCDLVTLWKGDEPLEVHCYDPHPPGGGAGFQVEQPEHMRLNIAPSQVHLPPLPPLSQWLREQGIHPAIDVARSHVGRYLEMARESHVRHPPPGVRVVTHSDLVEQLTPAEGGWLVSASMPQVVDEVLLATGHAPDHDERLSRLWDHDQPTRLVEKVYPVTTWLDEEHVPPGCTVATRGAGLTFVDVVADLTEGRDPSRWPARILPVGRSGRLAHATPVYGFDPLPDEKELLEVLGRSMPDDPAAIIETVRQAATGMLVLTGVERSRAEEETTSTLATGWEPGLPKRSRALASLHRSIAVAERARRPGPGWMLGRAWSRLRSTAIKQLAFHVPEPEVWQEYLRAANVLERFAFGPPLPAAIRLAGLCERGIVDLSWLEAGVSIDSHVTGIPEGDSQPDVVIDALLSPPGVRTARTPLVDSLGEQGLVRVASGRRGLDVTPLAECIDVDGSPVPGLSMIGLPIEDVVIGNDTLDHPASDLSMVWAQRLVDTAATVGR